MLLNVCVVLVEVGVVFEYVVCMIWYFIDKCEYIVCGCEVG